MAKSPNMKTQDIAAIRIPGPISFELPSALAAESCAPQWLQNLSPEMTASPHDGQYIRPFLLMGTTTRDSGRFCISRAGNLQSEARVPNLKSVENPAAVNPTHGFFLRAEPILFDW